MLQLCLYEIRLNLSTIIMSFCLFLLYSIIIPLLIGFSPEFIYHFYYGLIWLCILFAFLPERLFQQDFEDGTLELYFLSSCSIQPIFISKLLGYWCLKISGILCTFPLLSSVYHFEQSKAICITMILGSLVFTLICGIHSSLTVALQSNSWNSLQHFTTLPTLLPLILLCTYIQTEQVNFLALVGLVSLFVWIYWIFVSITLQNVLSH
uniref:Cytochrome b biosynthesis n=1 Tax=Zygnema circumcarinatum TaxID=35869 RepID=A0A6N0GXJ9_ZYGCR|nr:cytochrome b biosynthesis [Zygnema circumcarinatum]QKQ14683.1 cytochrome b biosynthesis [Zygnema circumcarinatum]WEL36328.1 cytochrome b biosynthesis [Zygnema circumcarinatum]